MSSEFTTRFAIFSSALSTAILNIDNSQSSNVKSLQTFFDFILSYILTRINY